MKYPKEWYNPGGSYYCVVAHNLYENFLSFTLHWFILKLKEKKALASFVLLVSTLTQVWKCQWFWAAPKSTWTTWKITHFSVFFSMDLISFAMNKKHYQNTFGWWSAKTSEQEKKAVFSLPNWQATSLLHYIFPIMICSDY